MNSLIEIGTKIYIDSEVLIDFARPLSNYSRLPLIQETPEQSSLYWTLIKLIKEHVALVENTDQAGYEDYYYLMDLLFSRFMTGIPGTRTTRTILLGSDDGILSYHLCCLLKAFHSDNEYFPVTDCKETDYLEGWKDMIASENPPDKTYFISGDYGNLQVEEKSFDFVILNGNQYHADSELMVRDAFRIVKDSGIIIAFNEFENTVFDDIYKMKRDERIKEFKEFMLEDERATIIYMKMKNNGDLNDIR